MKKILISLFLIIGTILISMAQPAAKRVILFMIDGLHWEAPEKLNMPVFNALIKQGTYIQKSYMIVPHHPTIGDYSKFNSCSFPNPVLHEGTLFLKPENKMIQEVFSPEQQTAFVVNTPAYQSVGRGFSTCIMDETLSDDQVVARAIEILETQHPVFMRIHLQTPGGKGFEVSQSSPDKPWYRNIFGKNSPYIKAVENADKLLGQFIGFLKKSGLWNETVLIITSDHGQSKVGWHPLFDKDSWMTPLIFVGPDIAHGRKLSYFEHTDLAPCIAGLLGKKAPNTDGGSGVSIKEIMKNNDASHYQPPMYIKTINEQIKEFNFLKARMIIASKDDSYFSNIIALLENEFSTPEPFYHQDRILDWHKAGTAAHLVEVNEKILKQMRQALEKENLMLREKLAPGDYYQPVKEKAELENRLKKLLACRLDESHKELVSFRKRMLKYKDYIPPDNNGSERAIRNVKVKQKISGQFKSWIGVENFMVLRSITDTALKNDQNVLRVLNLIAKFRLTGKV